MYGKQYYLPFIYDSVFVEFPYCSMLCKKDLKIHDCWLGVSVMVEVITRI